MRKGWWIATRMAVLGTVLGSATAWAGTSGWHTYRFEGAQFVVKFPTKPTFHEETRRTIAGSITTQIVESHTEDADYMVSRTVLPAVAQSFAGESKVVANAKGGLLADVFGKEVSNIPVERHGYKGHRVTYEVKLPEEDLHRYGVAEFYYVDGVLVIFDASVKFGQVDDSFFLSVVPDEEGPN